MAAGAVLILISLVTASIVLIGSAKADVDPACAAEFIESILPEPVAGVKEERGNSGMPVVNYENTGYAALLTVQDGALTLPVVSAWNNKTAKKVLCRYYGNPYDGSLVIGGTAAGGQFDFISGLDTGDRLTLADMKGYVFSYAVSSVRHANKISADILTGDGGDLTLFAKDGKTGKWVVVGCRLAG